MTTEEEKTATEGVVGGRSSKKRPRSPLSDDFLQLSAPSAAAAAQLCSSMGFNGLYSLLSASAITTSSSSFMPNVEQVKQAASKCVQECPPFVHLSKTDSAPQLKIVDDRRLIVKGGMRGYRMARVTHGVSSGSYYYEAIILDPPRISEIADALPPNVRMGRKLQQQIQQALLDEKEGRENSTIFGGHVRLGWSMRTGDLQAPVGYDKWSFAIRDIGGSKIHCSKRDDNWGGEDFGPGDVIGCAISLPPKDDEGEPTGDNTIKFFKNGECMGDFIISKGKQEGGDAFRPPDGIYYPAVSTYMGASVKLNPGPHFVFQPSRKLKLQPLCDLCTPPTNFEEAISKTQKEKIFRKSDMVQKFQDLVRTEVQVLQDSYQNHRTKHIQEIVDEREKRSLPISDLEQDEFYAKG